MFQFQLFPTGGQRQGGFNHRARLEEAGGHVASQQPVRNFVSRLEQREQPRPRQEIQDLPIDHRQLYRNR